MEEDEGRPGETDAQNFERFSQEMQDLVNRLGESALDAEDHAAIRQFLDHLQKTAPQLRVTPPGVGQPGMRFVPDRPGRQ